MSTPQPESKQEKSDDSSSSSFRVVHQTSRLHFLYDPMDASWSSRNVTTLLCTAQHSLSLLPLHLRDSCTIHQIHVNDEPAQFYHVDALTALEETEINGRSLMNQLRAASIASNLGEVRILVPQITATSPEQRKIMMESQLHGHGAPKVFQTLLQKSMIHPTEMRTETDSDDDDDEEEANDQERINRIDRIRKLVTDAPLVYKIKVEYSIENFDGSLRQFQNCCLGSIAGTYGDHQGVRMWLPCVDSPRARHSHQIMVSVTSACTAALRVVGIASGVSETFLHYHEDSFDVDSLVSPELKELLLENRRKRSRESSMKNIVPSDEPNEISLTDIFATNIFVANYWTPMPARSLGFAVGPFRVIADPEYAMNTGGSNNMQQAYLLPTKLRSGIHTVAAKRNFLRNVHLVLPEFDDDNSCCEETDKTVTAATCGVAHRALVLMKDVLRLPTFRTNSYTQIWIPGAPSSPLLGVAIMDARLLERTPFYMGGRSLQMTQARSAIRGWVLSALPLAETDPVGDGYLLALVEAFIMSLYERGHGAQGEGGGKGSFLYSKRYAADSGLNSPNLDFLPVQNIEDPDVVIEGLGAVPVEERGNDNLWRGASNGSESHTSALDEFNARQLFCRDVIEALERGTDKDKGVPGPSPWWTGSFLSLSFLSSNAASSSDLGCGAVELLHPVGGLRYRQLKCEVFRQVVEGRAGTANFLRLIRAAFIAAHLDDIGSTELKLPRRQKKPSVENKSEGETLESGRSASPPFVVCVNEILKKKGLTHNLFTRALQNLSGPIREPQLRGSLVDAERDAVDPRTRRAFVEPEGFPNCYVRGASMPYYRVGVQVDLSKDASNGGQSSAVTKGIQMQAYVGELYNREETDYHLNSNLKQEPIIPEGGIAYGGQITMRVVENEGSFREYVKDLTPDGSRRDWGASFLHAKPVTTAKARTAASGTLETSSSDRHAASGVATLDHPVTCKAFSDQDFHVGGFQAIELIRLTNLSPLLWVRVDPTNQFGGRFSVFQPDACLAEQLFHDGDASAQIEAARALAERPLRIQVIGKVNVVYDVNVSELPCRVLADCLRGTPALHSSLPHTPAVRVQAALAISQWQNNKAPPTKDVVGPENWVGLNLLVQYFRERFYNNSVVIPCRLFRLSGKKAIVGGTKSLSHDGSFGASQPLDGYVYFDALEKSEQKELLEGAEELEVEEDEEYRVRSAVVTAISCIRAKDHLTPPLAIEFMEKILSAEDSKSVVSMVHPTEEVFIREYASKLHSRVSDIEELQQFIGTLDSSSSVPVDSNLLVADMLLALCNLNAKPATTTDPATGNQIQSSGPHPLSKLLKLARSWLDWELYREDIRVKVQESQQTGIAGNTQGIVSGCAIIGLSNLVIITLSSAEKVNEDFSEVGSAQFYMDIFDRVPHLSDVTRAAAAQAIICVCCAADRFDGGDAEPNGLLTALEFLLSRLIRRSTSKELRLMISLLMMDACTGKVCQMQRVGAYGGRNDLLTSSLRFYYGPLGPPHGSDNGSNIYMPASEAVNNGARRGMRLISRAGKDSSEYLKDLVVRVGQFAKELWESMNGKLANERHSVCAFDGELRCSLLALWQWIWPRECHALNAIQPGRTMMKEAQYLADIGRCVEKERDRQVWRGEMAGEFYKNAKQPATPSSIGIPLPPVTRDTAFRLGGWIASAAQQRRRDLLDGGTAVKKIRLVSTKRPEP